MSAFIQGCCLPRSEEGREEAREEQTPASSPGDGEGWRCGLMASDLESGSAVGVGDGARWALGCLGE